MTEMSAGELDQMRIALADIVTFQLNSLGKSGSNSELAVYAIDNDALAVGHARIDDPRPLIVTTAPAASRYFGGLENPYAYAVENTCMDNPIRARGLTLSVHDARALALRMPPTINANTSAKPSPVW